MDSVSRWATNPLEHPEAYGLEIVLVAMSVEGETFAVWRLAGIETQFFTGNHPEGFEGVTSLHVLDGPISIPEAERNYVVWRRAVRKAHPDQPHLEREIDLALLSG